jgi:hypothetical protein
MRTGLDFKSEGEAEDWVKGLGQGEAEDWVKMRGLEI